MIKKRMRRLFYQAMNREKRHILSEFVQVKGLMPLFMKQRNKQQWTTQDKRELKLRLKCLTGVSAYMAVVFMPGGLAILPVMTWWRERRRGRCATPEVQSNVPTPPGPVRRFTRVRRLFPCLSRRGSAVANAKSSTCT